MSHIEFRGAGNQIAAESYERPASVAKELVEMLLTRVLVRLSQIEVSVSQIQITDNGHERLM